MLEVVKVFSDAWILFFKMTSLSFRVHHPVSPKPKSQDITVPKAHFFLCDHSLKTQWWSLTCSPWLLDLSPFPLWAHGGSYFMLSSGDNCSLLFSQALLFGTFPFCLVTGETTACPDGPATPSVALVAVLGEESGRRDRLWHEHRSCLQPPLKDDKSTWVKEQLQILE